MITWLPEFTDHPYQCRPKSTKREKDQFGPIIKGLDFPSCEKGSKKWERGPQVDKYLHLQVLETMTSISIEKYTQRIHVFPLWRKKEKLQKTPFAQFKKGKEWIKCCHNLGQFGDMPRNAKFGPFKPLSF